MKIETEIPTVGQADFDVESSMVAAFEDAIEALGLHDTAASDAVDAARMGIHWADAGESLSGEKAYVRDLVNTLVEQWGNLTNGRQTATVEPARYAIRLVLADA